MTMQVLTPVKHLKHPRRPSVYGAYSQHTIRKMVGVLEALARTGGRAANLDTSALGALNRQRSGHNQQDDYSWFRSYPAWFKRDIITVYHEPACWQTQGLKNALSVDGRVAVAAIHAKLGGFFSKSAYVTPGHTQATGITAA